MVQEFFACLTIFQPTIARLPTSPAKEVLSFDEEAELEIDHDTVFCVLVIENS